MSRFDRAFELVMLFEGGDTITKDRNDPGGTTKYGISQRAFPNIDIEKLTEAEAKEIYKKYYWDVVKADEFSPPLDVMLFDTAVNMGPRTAARMIQRALSETSRISIDGIIGHKTITAAGARLPAQTAYKFAALRIMAYVQMKHFGRYGRGWINRVMQLAYYDPVPFLRNDE